MPFLASKEVLLSNDVSHHDLWLLFPQAELSVLATLWSALKSCPNYYINGIMFQVPCIGDLFPSYFCETLSEIKLSS